MCALQQLAACPALERRCVLQPVDELGSLDFGALVIRLDLPLLSVYDLPLLFLDGDKALLELIAAENDREWHLVLLASSELRGQFWLVLVQEVRLREFCQQLRWLVAGL